MTNKENHEERKLACLRFDNSLREGVASTLQNMSSFAPSSKRRRDEDPLKWVEGKEFFEGRHYFQMLAGAGLLDEVLAGCRHPLHQVSS